MAVMIIFLLKEARQSTVVSQQGSSANSRLRIIWIYGLSIGNTVNCQLSTFLSNRVHQAVAIAIRIISKSGHQNSVAEADRTNYYTHHAAFSPFLLSDNKTKSIHEKSIIPHYRFIFF